MSKGKDKAEDKLKALQQLGFVSVKDSGLMRVTLDLSRLQTPRPTGIPPINEYCAERGFVLEGLEPSLRNRLVQLANSFSLLSTQTTQELDLVRNMNKKFMGAQRLTEIYSKGGQNTESSLHRTVEWYVEESGVLQHETHFKGDQMTQVAISWPGARLCHAFVAEEYKRTPDTAKELEEVLGQGLALAEFWPLCESFSKAYLSACHKAGNALRKDDR